MSSTAVPVIRRGHAPRPADDPARRGSTVGRPGTASAQLLVLQRTAGNTAVRHLMREIDRERAKKDLCVGQKVDAAAALTTFTPAQAQVLRIVRQQV